jgi:hypothetical protein
MQFSLELCNITEILVLTYFHPHLILLALTLKQ